MRLSKVDVTRLKEMLDELTTADKEILPSKYWIELNKKNIDQLEKYGYENFKRTLALNYFTFRVGFNDVQIQYLMHNLQTSSVIKCGIRSLLAKKHQFFSYKHSLTYNFHAHMLWEFCTLQDKERLLYKLFEPLEGNPPKVFSRNKLIS